MQRKILSALVFAILNVAVMPAVQAGTVANNFTVSVGLSAQCTARDSGSKTLSFGTYSAFQATPQSAGSIEVAFECTRGLVPSDINFDSANGTVVGGGVLAGLNYDMDFAGSVVTAGSAASAAAGDSGSADIRTYTISGTMGARQAGELAQPVGHTRMLIVTY